MKALEQIIRQASQAPATITLSEAEEPRVLQAALLARQSGIARIVLVGADTRIRAAAARHQLLLDGLEIYDPASAPQQAMLADIWLSLRKHKGMNAEQATREAASPLLAASLLVRAGLADGTVSGAVHTTADVVRIALQAIGPAPGCRLVSSFFLMMLCQPFHQLKGGLIFADCGLVVEPDSEQLAQIAISASQSARALLGSEPRVAMLSFSTNGSAQHAAVDKVSRATRLVKASHPALHIDGDIQLDAAIVAEIAKRKLPDSTVQGKANVLVFPNLEAGNIAYKLAERMGGAIAVGPLLQGLAKPANDLSRGCSSEDIHHVIAVTVVQAQQLAAAGKQTA
ncbi:phosphate acetyltransferase [Aquitalea sp. ASV15]|uniref:phosphate acetyltransferase n=1 Tax=Aquitalea sp. ASV15 TaxID=2795104 RepID=UPI0018ECDF69|nr:phosphate acetyltransferase [Aquitalea sp. ASV15]